MNIVRAFRAPWVAAQPAATRWTVAIALAVDLVAATAAAAFASGMAGVRIALLGIGLLWVFPLPSMLWLTQAANRLRLPAVRRDVNLGLGLWAALSLAVPAALAVATGARPLVAVLLAAVVACLWLLYATLPWLAAMGVCLVPAFAPQALRALHLPGPYTAGFIAWIAPVAGALLVLAAWRWQRLQRRENLMTYYLYRPIVLGFSRSMRSLATATRSSSSGRSVADPMQLLRQRPDWLQPRADLRRTGPAHPRRSLRVAFGGQYLPQQRRWRVMLVAAIVAVVAIMVWGPAMLYTLGQGWSTPAAGSVFVGAEVVLALVAAVVPVGFAQWLQVLWRRPDAELAMLALLPRLAPTGRINRELLEAALGKPLVILAVIWVLMGGIAVGAHLHVGALVLALVVPPLSAGLLAVLMLNVVAGALGRTGTAVFEWVSIPAAFILAGLSTGVAPHFPGVVEWLALAWLGWAAFVAAVGWMAARHLASRPHPFLAQAR